MRQAAQIICPDHPLHGARVRPIGAYGRTAILLDDHGKMPRMTRVIVPPGMLSDDGPEDAPGTVRLMCREANRGELVLLHVVYTHEYGIKISVYVPHNGGGTVRGMLRLNAMQNAHAIGVNDPVNTETVLDCNHPVTGEDYRIRPSDLARAAERASEDVNKAGQRAVIVAPYNQLDGVRCVVTGNRKAITYPCDPLSARCLKVLGAECTCMSDGREIVLTDDAPPSEWAEAGNAAIIRAGEMFHAGPGQLSSDHTSPSAVCGRCPRSVPIGLYCPAHLPE